MTRHIRISQRAAKALGGVISIGALMAFGGAVSAQAGDGGWVDPSSLDGVVSVERMSDGGVRITFEDGRVIDVEAAYVNTDGGRLLVHLDGIDSAAAVDLSPALLLGGGALLIGGAAAAFGGGGDSNAAPTFSSASASASTAENATTTGYTAAASDPENDTLTYSIAGGADAGRFTINASTGELTFVSAPDFESPGDANSDNAYEVIIEVSDGQQTASQTVTISVTNINDNAPQFTLAATGQADEGATATTYAAAATDADGDTVTFSISGGADAALFAIDATTGVLTLIAAQDFEAPGDANADGVYEVQVQAGDGTNISTQTVLITLQDVNEDPSITSGATATTAENTAGVVYDADATDPDGDTLTYAISGGADASQFTIDTATGELRFATPPDFENPSDANQDNTYEVIIEASDGARSVTQAVTIDVTNVNDNAPGFTSSPNIAVDENLTAAGQVTATDLDGDTITYSIIFGADQSLFTIDSVTGELFFVTAPDFEAPGDQNADNVYELLVRASDGTNTVDQTVFVTVGNANDNAPQFTVNQTAFALAENTSGVLGTVDAIDADGSTLTWSVSGGPDASAVSINAATGELSLVAPLDFEAPSDSNQDNVYSFEITVSDGVATDTVLLTMTVTNVNDVAPVFSSGTTASQLENTTVTGYTAAAADAVEGDAVTYSIGGGADGALFTIDANTGVLSFLSSPDFENPGDADTDNVYEVIIRANDGANDTDQTVLVTVNDIVNELAPVFTSGATASFDENGAGPAYTATSIDPQNDPVTYAITGGADAALFSINPTTGEVTFNTAPDFEAPVDAGADNVYEIDITATDGANPTIQPVQITVNNINDNTPVITTAAGPWNAPENATGVVVNVDATDADNDTLTYSISGGADAALFAIDAATGFISFITAPDFENPLDAGQNNGYEVEVQVSDGVNASVQTFQINVSDQNDNAPEITSSPVQSIDENSTATIVTATAIDADATANLTWSISGGADGALFAIDANTGALSFIAGQNFENPADAGQDGGYEVEITVSDGSFSDTQLVTVTLNDVNEAPVFNFTGPIAFNVAENTVDTTFDPQAASDPDGDALTYTLTGADAALFQIGASGRIEFLGGGADFEVPTDANTDGVYEVTIVASDGVLTDTLDLEITVTDANDAPQISSAASQSVAENNTVVYTASATDQDASATLSWSITGGADASLFTIDATTGQVSFLAAPDFENPADAGSDNVYDLEITASDGTASDAQSVQVTVTNINDVAPVFSSGGAVSVAENETVTGYVAAASDPVEGDPVTYSIGGGADGALFTIDANTGALSFINPPDFENPADANTDNVYDVVVRANDGANDTDQSVQVTVTDVAVEGQPVITSPSTFTTPESGVASNIFTVTATDPQNDPITWSMVGGPDASKFNITSAGVVQRFAGVDFENPTDANQDNVYEFTIQASDGVNTTQQTLFVTVIDQNDNPTIFTSPSAASVAENTTGVAYATTITDADSLPIVFSISGTDAALFSIDATTGAVSFNTAPNFEAPADAGADNVYNFVVTATTGIQGVSHAVALTVTDVNEPVSITSAANFLVAENSFGINALSLSDDDIGNTHTWTITGGADAALFNINGSTSAVGPAPNIGFINAKDFETPQDADQDNVYEVEIQLSDGANVVTQLITFTLTDLNDTAPTVAQNNPLTMEENSIIVDGQIANPATDPDTVGGPLVYSLVGADAALFSIDSATGIITKLAAPDFENPDDANADGVYEVGIIASDGVNQNGQGGIQITLQDLASETLTFNTVATGEVDENSAFQFTVIASGNTGAVSYAITGGADASLFSIDTNTGLLTYTGPALDHEAPGDAGADNVYDVEVSATDSLTTIAQNFAMTVQDINDNPTTVPSTTIAVNFAENQTGLVVNPGPASDADADAIIRWNGPFGADAAFFTVDTLTGEISLSSALDFENPQDANSDNTYEFTVQAFDNRLGAGFAVINVSITITDVGGLSESFGEPVIVSAELLSWAGADGQISTDDFLDLQSLGRPEPFGGLIGVRAPEAGSDGADLARTVHGAEVLSLDAVSDLSVASAFAGLDVLDAMSLDLGQSFLAAPVAGEPRPAFEPLGSVLPDPSSASPDEAWSLPAEPDFLGV